MNGVRSTHRIIVLNYLSKHQESNSTWPPSKSIPNSNALLYNRLMLSQAKASDSMTCPVCQIGCRRFGKHRNGLQRFNCRECGKTYTEEHSNPLGNMSVSFEKALFALTLLVEETSVRAIERTTGLHRDTICRLLVIAGEKCERIMGQTIRNIQVRDVEIDEVWSVLAFL